jgi:hypothetical protein
MAAFKFFFYCARSTLHFVTYIEEATNQSITNEVRVQDFDDMIDEERFITPTMH